MEDAFLICSSIRRKRSPIAKAGENQKREARGELVGGRRAYYWQGVIDLGGDDLNRVRAGGKQKLILLEEFVLWAGRR